MEFSENINADKLLENLIITPQVDIRYKHVVKHNQLTLKFEDFFNDSTTYSLNFLNGVTDATENNPVINLVVAFSTGEFIDSMKVSGVVQNILSQKSLNNFIVGLYPLNDSLDYFSQSPTYFTTTNDSGRFEISYVKAGPYKILSFNDGNKNLILDSETEDHGFISDTLKLYDSALFFTIPTLLQDVKPLKLINHRSLGSYHEIRFNKRIDSYSLHPDTFFSNIIGEKKDIIRLYNPQQFAFADSISVIVEASDSLENNVTDTLKISFNEPNRPPSKFSYSITYPYETLQDKPTYILKFNKPITQIDTSKLVYKADSTFSFMPDSVTAKWNQNKTVLELTTHIVKDSLFIEYKKVIPTDTLKSDSIQNKTKKEPPLTIDFFALKGAFISVEEDSSTVKSIKHKEFIKNPFGVLKLNLSSNHTSFITQLLSGEKVAYQEKNTRTPLFQVKPGTYSVRILIDSNNDGKWSYGNLLQNKEPEDIYLFPDPIAVRENWIIEDINISF